MAGPPYQTRNMWRTHLGNQSIDPLRIYARFRHDVRAAERLRPLARHRRLRRARAARRTRRRADEPRRVRVPPRRPPHADPGRRGVRRRQRRDRLHGHHLHGADRGRAEVLPARDARDAPVGEGSRRPRGRRGARRQRALRARLQPQGRVRRAELQGVQHRQCQSGAGLLVGDRHPAATARPSSASSRSPTGLGGWARSTRARRSRCGSSSSHRRICR